MLHYLIRDTCAVAMETENITQACMVMSACYTAIVQTALRVLDDVPLTCFSIWLIQHVPPMLQKETCHEAVFPQFQLICGLDVIFRWQQAILRHQALHCCVPQKAEGPRQHFHASKEPFKGLVHSLSCEVHIQLQQENL